MTVGGGRGVGSELDIEKQLSEMEATKEVEDARVNYRAVFTHAGVSVAGAHIYV